MSVAKWHDSAEKTLRVIEDSRCSYVQCVAVHLQRMIIRYIKINVSAIAIVSDV